MWAYFHYGVYSPAYEHIGVYLHSVLYIPKQGMGRIKRACVREDGLIVLLFAGLTVLTVSGAVTTTLFPYQLAGFSVAYILTGYTLLSSDFV